MRKDVLIVWSFALYFIFPKNVNGQEEVVSLGLTNYSYYYTTEFQEGTSSVGSTLLLFSNKTSFQIGLLYGFKRYEYYSRVSRYKYERHKQIHILFLTSLSYHYYSIKNSAFNLTGGLIIDNRKHTNGRSKIALNLFIGTGFQQSLNDWFLIRGMPMIRYFEGAISPGMMIDLYFRISKFTTTKV